MFGSSASKGFEAREVAGYYYAILACPQLGGELKDGKVFCDENISVSTDGFLTWAAHFKNKVQNFQGER